MKDGTSQITPHDNELRLVDKVLADDLQQTFKNCMKIVWLQAEIEKSDVEIEMEEQAG